MCSWSLLECGCCKTMQLAEAERHGNANCHLRIAGGTVSSTLCSACTIYSRFFKSCATSVNRLKFQRQIRFLPKAILKFASHDVYGWLTGDRPLERRIWMDFRFVPFLRLVQVAARNRTFPLPDAEPASRQHVSRNVTRPGTCRFSRWESNNVSCSCRRY